MPQWPLPEGKDEAPGNIRPGLLKLIHIASFSKWWRGPHDTPTTVEKRQCCRSCSRHCATWGWSMCPSHRRPFPMLSVPGCQEGRWQVFVLGLLLFRQPNRFGGKSSIYNEELGNLTNSGNTTSEIGHAWSAKGRTWGHSGSRQSQGGVWGFPSAWRTCRAPTSRLAQNTTGRKMNGWGLSPSSSVVRGISVAFTGAVAPNVPTRGTVWGVPKFPFLR